MSDSTIYRETLLSHIRNPKNMGSLLDPDLKASAYNPLCGDELELNIDLSIEKIHDCKTKVRGCSISIVSASMMSEMIKFKTLSDAEKIRISFLECLKKDNYNFPDNLEYLLPLISLKKHRSRTKCIFLAWDALQDCINQHKNSYE